MGAQEKLFCRMAEAQFRAYDTALTTAVLFPASQLRLLKGAINAFKNSVLMLVENQLEYIEQYLAGFLGENNYDVSKKINDFCRVAYTCKAAMEAMFPEDGNDPIFVQMIPKSVRDQLRNPNTSSYATFEQYVCKLSLYAMMEEFNSYILDSFEQQLDALLAKLGVNKLDELIADYMDLIAPFLRELDVLNKFAECAFAACNWTATALNKKEEYAEKCSVEPSGDGWIFKMADWMEDVNQREFRARSKIYELKNKIITFK